MILKIRNIEIPVIIDKQMISTLSILNIYLFREILSSILQLKNDNDTQNIITSEDCNLSKDLIVISNPFEFDFFAKNLLNDIYKQASNSIDNGLLTTLNHINNYIDKLICQTEEILDIELSYQDKINLIDCLKFAKARPIVGEEYDFKNRLYGIIEIISKLFKDKIICFVNVKSLLTEYEFTEFIQYSLKQELKILFLENVHLYKAKAERIIVVDDDLYSYELN